MHFEGTVTGWGFWRVCVDFPSSYWDIYIMARVEPYPSSYFCSFRLFN
jgi:hypothetical protein